MAWSSGRLIGMPPDAEPAVNSIDITSGTYLDPASPQGLVAEQHLADLTRRELSPLVVPDADFDPGARLTTGGEEVGIEVVLLGKCGREVRTLGLAEELEKDRAEAPERFNVSRSSSPVSKMRLA